MSINIANLECLFDYESSLNEISNIFGQLLKCAFSSTNFSQNEPTGKPHTPTLDCLTAERLKD